MRSTRTAAAELEALERMIDPPEQDPGPPPLAVTETAVGVPRTPGLGLDPWELEELLLALADRSDHVTCPDRRARLSRVRMAAELELAALVAY